MFGTMGIGHCHVCRGQLLSVGHPQRVCCPRQRGIGEPACVEVEEWVELVLTFVGGHILTGG